MPRLSVILAATLALSGCVGGGRTTISAAQEVPADAAGGACHAAVSAAVGRSGNDVLVYDRRATTAGTELRLTVAGQDGPWRCVLGADGAVLSAGPL
jgi:hypothetical protein